MKFFRVLGLFFALVFSGCENSGDLALQFHAETGVRWEFLSGFQPELKDSPVPGVRVLQGVRGGERLRILILPLTAPAEAPQKIDYHRRILDSSFATVPSPYAAVVSNKVGCDDLFRPRERTRGDFWWITYGANDRLASGACTRDTVRYRGHMAFLLAGTQLLKLEYFSQWTDSEDEKMGTLIEQVPRQLLLRRTDANKKK